MKHYVCGFLFSPDLEKVILIEKQKPDWQKGLLNGVGGKVEEGERSIEAMIREFREEAGVTITDWTLFASITNTRLNYSVDFYYAVDNQYRTCYTVTEELIMGVPVKVLHQRPTISNLPWLIGVALNKIKFPDEVIEVA